MCMWDVTHGRRRYAINQTITGNGLINVKPNRRRVGIIFSMFSQIALQGAKIFTGESVQAITFFAGLSIGDNTLSLRIEDVGSLVTGAWKLQALTDGESAITEILYDGDDDEQAH